MCSRLGAGLIYRGWLMFGSHIIAILNNNINNNNIHSCYVNPIQRCQWSCLAAPGADASSSAPLEAGCGCFHSLSSWRGLAWPGPAIAGHGSPRLSPIPPEHPVPLPESDEARDRSRWSCSHGHLWGPGDSTTTTTTMLQCAVSAVGLDTSHDHDHDYNHDTAFE